jgi:anthranilate 1,2-dioxygenase small subunit
MASLRDVVESLLYRYAATIDDGDLIDWPGFFAEDAEYKLIARENFVRGLPISVIYCKNRAMMRDRVIAIKKASVYTPHYYRHHYSNLLIERAGLEVTLRANYLVCRTQDDGDTIIFSTGRLIASLSVQEEASFLSLPPPSMGSSKMDPSSTDTAPWTIRSMAIDPPPTVNVASSPGRLPGLEAGTSGAPPRSGRFPALEQSPPSLPPRSIRSPGIEPSARHMPPPPSTRSDPSLTPPPSSRRRPAHGSLFLAMTVIYDTCRIPGLLVFPI